MLRSVGRATRQGDLLAARWVTRRRLRRLSVDTVASVQRRPTLGLRLRSLSQLRVLFAPHLLLLQFTHLLGRALALQLLAFRSFRHVRLVE